MSDRRGRRVFTTHFSRVLPPKPPPLPVRCRATGVSLGGLLRRFAKDSELGGLRRDFGPIAVNFMRAYNCQIVSSPPLPASALRGRLREVNAVLDRLTTRAGPPVDP